jgi:ABC-type branched-subunit amino acid transport system substrate-binding protein
LLLASDCRAGRSSALLRLGRFVLLGGSIIASGCSLSIFDRTECTVDADCSTFGDGSTCAEDGYCSVTGGSGGTCSTNQECVTQQGDYHICRKSDSTCVPLLTNLCTSVEGDYLDDNAFIIGSIGPVEGEDESTGRSELNAIALATSDFAKAANGLPPRPGAEGRRSYVVVGCNDNGDSATGVNAARHLVDTLQVPAIIGAAYSGITIDLTTEVTIPAGVLVISPSATSVALTDLDDQGLLWRTSPSDIFQGAALAQYAPRVEDEVRETESIPVGEKIHFTILHKGDAYGEGLAKALEAKLIINGEPALDASNSDSYTRFNYGDPDNPSESPLKYGAAATTAIDARSHIIAVFGTSEAISNVILQIESQWDSGSPPSYRPRFIGSDGVLTTALWDAVGKNDDLRRRITGSVPGTSNPLFQVFKSDFTAKFDDGVSSPDVFGAAGAFDAAYLLGFATVANADQPETGANLAQALKRMVPPGEPKSAAANDISATFQLLSAGKNVDFTGASGPLDFDVNTGEAPSDVLIWCMPSDSSGSATAGIASGYFFDASTNALGGTELGPQCKF